MSNVQVLEIDVGNSAFKWRVLRGELPIASGRSRLSEYAKELAPVFDEQAIGVADFARVASVAGSDFDSELDSSLREFGLESVCFAKVETRKNGVRCGYKDLGQLGVDRWVALLAAAQEFSGPLVVVDAGSAITIDLVDEHKEHIGGYILPGWNLLHESLISGTAIPNERIPLNFEADSINPGLDSKQAIGMARLLMCASSINTVMEDVIAEQSRSVRLVCTGGDSLRIMPHLKFEAEYRPDLVLDGLRVAIG